MQRKNPLLINENEKKNFQYCLENANCQNNSSYNFGRKSGDFSNPLKKLNRLKVLHLYFLSTKKPNETLVFEFIRFIFELRICNILYIYQKNINIY